MDSIGKLILLGVISLCAAGVIKAGMAGGLIASLIAFGAICIIFGIIMALAEVENYK